MEAMASVSRTWGHALVRTSATTPDRYARDLICGVLKYNEQQIRAKTARKIGERKGYEDRQ